MYICVYKKTKMANSNPPIKKEAKKLSTEKEKNPFVTKKQAEQRGYSDSAYVKTKVIKEEEKPTRLEVKKPFSKTVENFLQTINGYPKSGQPKKQIQTYEGGKLIMTEKQGTNILGQPKIKIKTTGEGVYKKGKEKITLTPSGVKRESTY